MNNKVLNSNILIEKMVRLNNNLDESLFYENVLNEIYNVSTNDLSGCKFKHDALKVFNKVVRKKKFPLKYRLLLKAYKIACMG